MNISPPVPCLLGARFPARPLSDHNAPRKVQRAVLGKILSRPPDGSVSAKAMIRWEK
jgi:hypothetical protein